MLIVWGTHVRKHTLGYVAELCPGCRAATPHDFAEVIHSPHLYYIPTERGKVVGYAVTCRQCNNAREIAPDRFVAMARKPARIDMLQQATNPGLASEIAELKEREERAQRGELGPEERLVAMQEALATFEEQAAKRAASTHFDPRSTVLCLATLVLPWFLIVPGLQEGAWSDAFFYAGLCSMGAGLVLSFHALATDVRRFIQRRLEDAIVARLKPFQPSPDELAQLVKSMRASKWTLGKKLDSAWLVQRMYSS